jgi:dihydroflavonol-4-reductase
VLLPREEAPIVREASASRRTGRINRDSTARKTLVTGATGLLGRHLVSQLCDRGYTVRVLVRTVKQREFFPENVEVVTGDIRTAGDVDAAVFGCRYVIHTCSTHVYNLPAEEMWAVNVEGTRHICDAVERHQCEKLVFTSTVSALKARGPATVPDPRLPARQRNSFNKQIAEELILSRVSRGLPAVVVNPSFFVGPFDHSPSPFRLWVPLAIIRPVGFVPTGGFNVVSAFDVARAHVWALENGKSGERYPVVGENVSLQDYVSMVNQATGRALVPKLISPRVLHSVAHGRVFDAYAAALLCRPNYVEVTSSYPTSGQPLVDLVNETVCWFKAHSPLVHYQALLRYVWNHYV